MDTIECFLNSLQKFSVEPGVYSIADGVTFGVRPLEGNDAVRLIDMHTDIAHRGAGLASETLRELCRLADEYDVTIWLKVEADDGLNAQALMDWYCRNGFLGDASEMKRAPVHRADLRTSKQIGIRRNTDGMQFDGPSEDVDSMSEI